jgi:hypothetical protein
MERKKQNGLLLAALLLAWVLSSCVCHTSAALLDSCTFRAEGRREPSAPAIYQLRGQYYLAHKVRFVCREDKVCIGGMVAVHGSEVHLPFGYERTPREKMLYFRLSPDAVRAYLGRGYLLFRQMHRRLSRLQTGMKPQHCRFLPALQGWKAAGSLFACPPVIMMPLSMNSA